MLQRGNKGRRETRPLDRQCRAELCSDDRRGRRPTGSGQIGESQLGSGVHRPQRLGERGRCVGRESRDRGQERPLIGPWLHRGRIQERRRSVLEALTMQGQGDQVAERTRRHEVLRREEPVVARQVQLGTGCHCLAQQRRPQRSSRGRSNRTVEEHPDVRTVARPGALQHGRYFGAMAGVEVGERVENPRPTIEVTRQQRARIAAHQRIDPDRRVATKVTDDDLVGER